MSSSSCAAAEATGLVAMDCMVVCCCCPCLVLQITVFLFVRLPKKVVVKSKRIILRRWHRRRSSAAAAKRGCSTVDYPAGVTKLEELFDEEDLSEGAFGGINGGVCGDDEGWKERCFAVDDDDDGGVWEALIDQEGLFWFGSFWGRPEQVDPELGDYEHVHPALRFPLVLERACN
ncbi:hypothetical protein E2562_028917 [Oryza meyeriana var. granulata]|uniref:Uncharacterized protein n=1 Tax=Oryza meyeriana var. granulata TaxID=110450 RepID=A0A6G1FDF8_9ORYZ|nr:hypothetical protein E2562_028917 [Oryza meyeriana var. granulata]